MKNSSKNKHLKKVVKTICVFYLTVVMCSSCQKDSELTLLVGTYTHGSSEGIYAYRFNPDDLTASQLNNITVDNPSHLAISPDAGFVYAVSESGGENSAVSAFTFDKKDGTMQLINRVKVEADPCYILLDSKRNYFVSANYSGGSLSFAPISNDGSLSDSVNSLQFYGKGTDPERQTKPHLHCVAISPNKKILFATDLGTDRIYRLEVRMSNKESGLQYDYNDSFDTRLEPRSGPRHLVFNEKGSRAYLINEISGKVTVFTVDSQDNLKQVQSVLADTCYAEGSADIHLSPDEKYLYVSTRLKGDGIVIFKVDSEGLLTRVGYQATGKHPRNFIITPDGNLMLVACKDAGMIQIFSINKQTGQLTDTGKSIAIDQPVCLKFVK